MRLKTLLIAAAVASCVASSWAKGDHAAKHGGIFVETKALDFEVVAKPDMIQVYVSDHGKAVKLDGAKAKLTLLNGSEKTQVRGEGLVQGCQGDEGRCVCDPRWQVRGGRALRGEVMRAVALACVAAVVLAGCASPIYEGGRAWDQGWREGKVEKVAPASELGGRHTYDCRYRDGAGRSAPGRFAVVGLENMSRHRHQVVPVDPLNEIREGDAVLSNLRNCEPPVVRSAR
jgi:hypothetical protein